MPKFIAITAVGLFAAALSSAPALADFDSSEPINFRSAAERSAMIQAENMRIQAENIYFQQQMLINSLQRGQILNNLIIINQGGNGSIDLNAVQTSSGNSTIDNDITGGIGF